MSAMTTFTVKSLRANKVRTGVTIAGVALAAALLTAVLTSFTSLADFLYRTEVAMSGAWQTCAISSGDRADEAFARDVTNAAEDDAVTSTATLTTLGVMPLEEDQARYMGDNLTVKSAGGDAEQMLSLRPSEGRMPASPDEIMLFGTWKSYGNVQLGDAFHVDGAGFERDYTVVGFYERMSAEISSMDGTTAITSGEPVTAGSTKAFLAFANAPSSEALREMTDALFPDANVELHASLLRYMGVTSDASIWTTFFALVAILAAVIMAACISLIYNAFNISVAERMRQFGLLSSVGATRGQIRRGVLLEALLISVCGIPAGVLLGVGGCWLTFLWLGPVISEITSGSGIVFQLAADVRFVLAACVLTLLVVVISAWIPAARASRSSVMDALRTQGTARIGKRGRARAMEGASQRHLWREGPIKGRLFGIAGRLSAIDRARSASRGRVASASLALAIVLLLTAGSLNAFLGQLVEVTGGGEPPSDVAVTAMLEEALEDAGASKDAFAGLYEELCKADLAIPVGWKMAESATAAVPVEMAGDALTNADGYVGIPLPDGTFQTDGVITALDDASFDAFAESLGLDPASFHEEGAVRALGMSRGFGNDGEMYKMLDVLAGTGTLDIEGADVEVAALADEKPPVAGNIGEGLELIVPMSAVQSTDLLGEEAVFRAMFDAKDGRHQELTDELYELAEPYFKASMPSQHKFISYNDYRAEANSTRMLGMVVNVFCLLFTGILALIALANVFNTVTNDLILRRREFAVMRSVGLSDRQFHRLVASDCASFGVAGLLPGLIVSVGVSALIWWAVSQSLAEMPYVIPWGYVALAVGLTAAAMAASVAYGMHRCHADSVVEALR